MKRKAFASILLICLCGGLMWPATRVKAFSLLGPYEDWMQSSNDFRLPFDFDTESTLNVIRPGDSGGPMCISNGYRWNVPVVTYGFDQSFLNFFGSNGVAAVEAAIQILNDLPPASSMVVTDYPTSSQGMNYQANTQSLNDLKSAALGLLIEQLGLASPTRSIYVLRSATPPEPYSDFHVIQRNFDPATLLKSDFIDGLLYTYQIASLFPAFNSSWALSEPATTGSPGFPAVADNALNMGGLFTGLTQDDVGGMRYLLSTNNINYEMLLPGISGAGSNSNSFVNGAWRPGVDKITLAPHSYDTAMGGFLPMTNQFIDTYITNNTAHQQTLQRIATQPDFLFCAGDTYAGTTFVLPFSRTGTSNWLNNASLNGNPSGAGPGVIQPPVKITFGKLGRQFAQESAGTNNSVYDMSTFWGSYDLSTNVPIVYPVPQSGTNQLTIRVELVYGSFFPRATLAWKTASQAGATLLLQTSIDLTNWITLAPIQNDGSICTLVEYSPSSAQGFYRVVPQ